MKQLPVYSTNGDWVAWQVERYLFDVRGDCIGWLDGKDVHTRDGEYVGWLSDDRRVLRKRIREHRPLRPVPPLPPRIRVPARAPLAPLFAELSFGTVDVFEEEPEVFKYVSDRRPDAGEGGPRR